MSTNELTDLLSDHLTDQNVPKEEMLVRYNEIQDYLSYARRIFDLSDNAKKDFYETMEGGVITKEMKETLCKCKSQKDEDHYIDMWSRSNYFKKCSWMAYLHGEDKNIPYHE